MNDPTRRIARWRAKFTPEKQMATVAEIYDDMVRRYEEAAVALCTMESRVKQVLDIAGVHTSLYVAYLDYGRQLFRLSRKLDVSGNSFALAAQVLLEKWASRGLDPAVLAQIRSGVFSISPPAP